MDRLLWIRSNYTALVQTVTDLGGWLWLQAPWLPFVLSGAVGLCGVGFYVVSHPSRIGK